MKRLNTEEIKYFADVLNFTESEAKDITDLFYTLKMEQTEKNWRINTLLNSVEDYIKEWKEFWHRETNFSECYKYEKENEYSEYEPSVAKEIFASEEAFRNYAMDETIQFVYQLPNNEMVVVVY